jgi:hypothetical protein
MSTQPLAEPDLKPAAKPKISRANKNSRSKSDLVLRAMRRKSGVSLNELCKLTGWQAHSVRGFLSGTARKKVGHDVIRRTDAKGITRYSIGKAGSAS